MDEYDGESESVGESVTVGDEENEVLGLTVSVFVSSMVGELAVDESDALTVGLKEAVLVGDALTSGLNESVLLPLMVTVGVKLPVDDAENSDVGECTEGEGDAVRDGSSENVIESEME